METVNAPAWSTSNRTWVSPPKGLGSSRLPRKRVPLVYSPWPTNTRISLPVKLNLRVVSPGMDGEGRGWYPRCCLAVRHDRVSRYHHRKNSLGDFDPKRKGGDVNATEKAIVFECKMPRMKRRAVNHCLLWPYVGGFQGRPSGEANRKEL